MTKAQMLQILPIGLRQRHRLGRNVGLYPVLGAKLKTLVTSLFLAAMAAPAMAQSYPTIVGEWYAEEIGPQDCGGPFAFHIGAMHYVEEALVCDFDDVRRDGWRVTWNGSCHDGSTSSPAQVVALEDRGRLTMWFNGHPGWTALRRCNARSGAVLAPAPVPPNPLQHRQSVRSVRAELPHPDSAHTN